MSSYLLPLAGLALANNCSASSARGRPF